MFRFSIRDVLWLTVVVALGICWWLDRVALDKERASLKAQGESLAAEQVSLKAKQRALEAQFLRMVEGTDRLNEMQVRQTRYPLYNPPNPDAR